MLEKKLNSHLVPDIMAHEQGYQIWQIWYFGLTLASPLNPKWSIPFLELARIGNCGFHIVFFDDQIGCVNFVYGSVKHNMKYFL